MVIRVTSQTRASSIESPQTQPCPVLKWCDTRAKATLKDALFVITKNRQQELSPCGVSLDERAFQFSTDRLAFTE